MTLSDNKLYLEDIKNIDSYNLDFEKFKNANFLISGGTGLIGTVLVDTLFYINNKYNLNISLYLITRNKENAKKRFSHIKDFNLNFIEQDINNCIETEVSFDYIIHGASNTHPKLYAKDPVGCLTTNVFGTYNLLELTKKNKASRFLLLSSVEIYGEDNSNSEDGLSERDFGYLDCNTVRANYCEGKRASESLCQAYKSQYNSDVIIARLCRVYGPSFRMDDSKAVNQFIKNALNNEDIILKSEGKQFYSYIYVSDAVSALIFILLNGSNGEAYNISDKKSDVHLCDLAKLIATEANKTVIFDLPDEIESKGYSKATKAILNSTKINNLGWKPVYSIKDGINRTVKILKELNK